MIESPAPAGPSRKVAFCATFRIGLRAPAGGAVICDGYELKSNGIIFGDVLKE